MQINNIQEQPAGHQVVGQWLQFPLWNTLNVETVSHNVALYFYLDRQLSLSSRRAKRAGWPKGLKGAEWTFQPFGPVSALRRRLLHRNGNFVPLAP